MKIYVLVYTNNFSLFYFLCITNMPHHFPTMNFTHINYTKTFHNKKSQFPSQFYSIKLLHSYNNLFLSSESVFKGHKHPLIYYRKEN